jgi:hypothetical protein
MKTSRHIANTQVFHLTGSEELSPKANIRIEDLPFGPGDITAGTENELQALVVGKRTTVDLPLTIERSKYYSNIVRRIAVGEASTELIRELQKFLSDNAEQVWENSWVRFPRKYVSPFASNLLDRDLTTKSGEYEETRTDHDKFVFATNWGEWVRVPISYLVKLALADVVGTQPTLPPQIKATALNLLPHFSNDLTSPETFSFYLVISTCGPSFGMGVAREMSLRYLLTHLLVEWANKVMNLEAIGQHAAVNFAPHPAVRQRELNNCVSDAFYRELFVSPCLSGWTDGEAKHEYMLLAHQIMSRSQINAVVKLREAGIIINNLVVLPNTSTVSLANNGTHLTLGSKKITNHISDPSSGYTAADGKRIGDLVIKICEHFLPLFVGIYTAAPYRLGFSDFHPERALGFLPHELDYTHLRMLWRHWKRKARLRVFGHSITPYGPQWIDGIVSSLFQLRGDVVPDYRLIDFPVAWLCTETASALDGQIGNTKQLKRDLENMGVSDRNLKLYLPFGLREVDQMGFFGFEGRHYSLFESMSEDFGPAADLQQLITMLSYKYAQSGQYTHSHLPDDPSSESERRLPFFYAALGLPAFNVRLNTPNDLIRRLAAMTKGSIASRHSGYVRLELSEYRLGLLRLIEEDAADCVELLGLKPVLEDLRSRIQHRELTACGKLMQGIVGKRGKSNALAADAREFNLAAERFYREELKQKHLREALGFVRESLKSQGRTHVVALRWIFGDLNPMHFLNEIENSLVDDKLTPAQLRALINLMLWIIRSNSERPEEDPFVSERASHDAPIHRPAYAASL